MTSYKIGSLAYLVSFLIVVPLPLQADTIRVPGDYPTIQGAVDAASDGDTIIVDSDGSVYAENVTISKPLTLTWDDGPVRPVIDGNGNPQPAIFINQNQNISIIGFRIRNSSCGICAEGVSNLLIKDCIIEDNSVGIGLGILDLPPYLGVSVATIVYNVIQGNGTGIMGGGVDYDGNFADIIIRHNTISESAGSGFYLGWGMPFSDFAYYIEDNDFFGNGACGIVFDSQCYDMFIRRNRIYGNGSSGITANIALLCPDVAHIEGNLIVDNENGVHMAQRDDEYGCYGLRIACGAGGENSEAIPTNGSDFHGTLINNTIVHNTCSGLEYRELQGGWYPGVKNNIFAYNGRYGIVVEDSFTTFTVTHNDVFQNSCGNYGGTLPDQTGVNGNISDNPLFIDNGSDISGNYHLGSGSPCINAGDPDPAYNDHDGTRNDIGAYGGPNLSPITGCLGRASASNIFGWGYDPDAGESPIDVEFYFDGPTGSGTYAATVTADLYRPDVPLNVPSVQGDYHGFSWDPSGFIASQGYAPGSVHDVYVYLVNQPTGMNPLLGTGSITVPENENPYGSLGEVSATKINGWAYDPDAGTSPIDVQIYFDGEAGTGTLAAMVTANLYRPDVPINVPLVEGDYHGFEWEPTIFLPSHGYVAGSTHPVYVYAVNQPAGTNKLLGSGSITLPPISPDPYGCFGAASWTGIFGWAYDPDAGTSPIDVQIYFDGPAGSGTYAATVPANGYRPDVPINVPSVEGDYHGFGWDPISFIESQGYPQGSVHDVYVYAVNQPAGTNPLLGTRSITVPSSTPYGSLGGASATSIGGWGYDPDAGEDPIDVEFYFDGPAESGTYATTVTADGYRPDVPINVPSVEGDYHGFDWDPSGFIASQGYAPGSTHPVYVYAVNLPAGTNPLLGTGSITLPPILNQNPYGSFGAASWTEISGWAYDPDAGTSPIDVQIYFDGPAGSGTYAATVPANGYRPDVPINVPSVQGDYHGFVWDPTSFIESQYYSQGTVHDVYVYGVNQPAGSNPLLGTKWIAIYEVRTPYSPYGSLDGVSSTSIWGWAYDPDAGTSPIDVAIFFDEPCCIDAVEVAPELFAATVTANSYRPDVPINVPSVLGDYHGFEWDPTYFIASQGYAPGSVHMVYVYGVDVDEPPAGGAPYLLGVGSVTIP